jgi:hypothetical protein
LGGFIAGYYALRHAPRCLAIVRVPLTTLLGYLAALPPLRLRSIEPRWGVAAYYLGGHGLGSNSPFAAGYLRRIGQVGVPIAFRAGGVR